MADGKTSSGGRVRRVPADVWNAMVDVGIAHRDGRLSNPNTPTILTRSPHLVKIKNETGDVRERGEVLSLNELILEDLDPDHFWLSGKDPQRGKHFAILRSIAHDDEIVEAQVIGLTVARVKITSDSHRFARLPDEAGVYVLESCTLGPMELLYAPDLEGAEELEADCLVNIRSPAVGVFKTPSGGIAGRSTDTCGNAECDTYWIDNDGLITQLLDANDDPIKTTIFNMFTGSIGGSRYITAKDVHGIAVIDAEDCG